LVSPWEIPAVFRKENVPHIQTHIVRLFLFVTVTRTGIERAAATPQPICRGHIVDWLAARKAPKSDFRG
jgi:hypothetical protein